MEALIRKTHDPVLRQKFAEMLDCPIVDMQGRCHNFTEYILNSLLRHGIHRQHDIEAALQHVFEKMMLDRSLMTGEPRKTVFQDFDPNRPYQPGDNPLQARFITYLTNTIRNIKTGSVPRLGKVERPQGMISIGTGRSDERGVVSPEEIAAPEAGFQELLNDIRGLLSRRERENDLPLLNVLDDMLAGRTVRERQAKYGYTTANKSRTAILDTIELYARSTGNMMLLNMLRRLQEPDKPKQVTRPKPKLSPQEKDYASILAVIHKLGRPVGSSDLGRYRRRWMEYAPRDPDSPYRNRLEATLAAMIEDGVLVKQGRQYWLGPHATTYGVEAA